MDIHAKLLEIVKGKGPLMPSQANVEIGQTILITSALLGELASEGRLKISHLKIGGSPLYYLPGQEDKLQNFADKLHEREKQAYELLKEKKMLRDSEQTPVMRVALRQIQDFAITLEVEFEHGGEILWRWYLLDESESRKVVRELLALEKEGPHKKPPLEKIEEEEPTDIEKRPEVFVQKEPVAIVAEKRKEETKRIPETHKEPRIIPKKEISKESQSSFLEKLTAFFNEKGIEVMEKKILKKNAEIDLILQVPSPVGKIMHYCKAKSKKKINDADLSQAYVQGQIKKLPVLFITTGDITKKTAEMLGNEFKSISVVKI